MTRRLALVVGDTAGHVNPALAVAEEYRALFGEVDVLFLAAEGGPASHLVPASGYDLTFVPALPLARTGASGKVSALARVLPCIARARRVLRGRGSRLVIGSGGYASGSVLIAARTLGLHTALIEPNAELGLANRFLKRIAGRAYVAFADVAAHFPKGRALVTGAPVRRQISASVRNERRPWQTGDPVRVLITTGSRGDEFLAMHVPGLLAHLRDRGLHVEVLHQTGHAQTDTLSQIYRDLNLPASVVPRLGDMAEAYTWATFAITRAGAGTLSELAIAGLPALLVPLADAAADHQATNARRFADAGAAIWTREPDWKTEQLADRLAAVLTDDSRWRAFSQSARQLARPDAAGLIVRDCEDVMRGHW